MTLSAIGIEVECNVDHFVTCLTNSSILPSSEPLLEKRRAETLTTQTGPCFKECILHQRWILGLLRTIQRENGTRGIDRLVGRTSIYFKPLLLCLYMAHHSQSLVCLVKLRKRIRVVEHDRMNFVISSFQLINNLEWRLSASSIAQASL